MCKKYISILLLSLIPFSASADEWSFKCLMRDFVRDIGKEELVHMPVHSFVIKVDEIKNNVSFSDLDFLSGTVMEITEKSKSDFWSEGLIKLEAKSGQSSIFLTNSFLVFVNANPFEPAFFIASCESLKS